MAEMDGITAAQVIRKLRPKKGPRIVAITPMLLMETGRSVSK